MLKPMLPLETYLITSRDSYPPKKFPVSQLFCPKSAALSNNPYDTPTLPKNFAPVSFLPNKDCLYDRRYGGYSEMFCRQRIGICTPDEYKLLHLSTEPATFEKAFGMTLNEYWESYKKSIRRAFLGDSNDS